MPLVFWTAHINLDLTLAMLDEALICFPATAIKRSDQKPSGKEGIGFSLHLQLTLLMEERQSRNSRQEHRVETMEEGYLLAHSLDCSVKS